jgi:hypothetical protein
MGSFRLTYKNGYISTSEFERDISEIDEAPSGIRCVISNMSAGEESFL